MKIVMVAPFAIEPKGTVKARMIPIANGLKKRGYSVDIVVPPWDNPTYSGKTIEIEGIKTHNVKSGDPSYTNLIKTVIKLCIYIKKLNPDIIYIFKPIGYSGFTAIWFSLIKYFGISKTPVFVDTDDWEGYGGQNNRSTYSSTVKWLVNKQEKIVLQKADSVTVASKTLQTLSWGLGIDPNNVYYVPNGQHDDHIQQTNIDNRKIKIKYDLDKAKIILLYTRFFEFDLLRLVNIFKQVKNEVGDAKLFVIGRGRFQEEKKFYDIIKKEGLDASTIMVGWVDFNELPNYISIADVAIYPFDDTLINRTKCPVKLTELMRLGLPIVADRVGQIQEYIEHKVSGLLNDPADDNAFSQNVVELLKNKPLSNKLGSNARIRILNEFSWDIGIDKIEFMFGRVANIKTMRQNNESA